jgi:hypothetical protein
MGNVPQVPITAIPAGGYMDECAALTVLEPASLPAELARTLELAADFVRASKAPATQAAYASDWQIFTA